MSKKLSIKEKSIAFNEKIEKELSEKIIVPKITSPTSGCNYCKFSLECPKSIYINCMAHNRQYNDSIYYAIK